MFGHQTQRFSAFQTVLLSKHCHTPKRELTLDQAYISLHNSWLSTKRFLLLKIIHKYLRNINEGCSIMSTLCLCLMQQLRKDKYSICGAFPPAETKLFLPNHVVILHNLGHSFTHPNSYQSQEVRWNGYRSIL